jgi:hypothetical protein
MWSPKRSLLQISEYISCFDIVAACLTIIAMIVLGELYRSQSSSLCGVRHIPHTFFFSKFRYSPQFFVFRFYTVLAVYVLSSE